MAIGVARNAEVSLNVFVEKFMEFSWFLSVIAGPYVLHMIAIPLSLFAEREKKAEVDLMSKRSHGRSH